MSRSSQVTESARGQSQECDLIERKPAKLGTPSRARSVAPRKPRCYQMKTCSWRLPQHHSHFQWRYLMRLSAPCHRSALDPIACFSSSVAADSLATTSSGRRRHAARQLFSSWAILVAPAITPVTPCWCVSHARARSAIGMPQSPEMAWMAASVEKSSPSCPSSPVLDRHGITRAREPTK